MKRDMDLVRDILKEAAASDGPFDAKALASEAHPFEEIAAHVEMLDEAGYVRAEVTRAWGGVPAAAKIERLTWEGSDFLDAVASDRIWAKVKRKVGGTFGDVPVSTLKALASKIATDFLTGRG